VVLDEMPYGNFVEIEGEKEAIERIIQTLELGDRKRFDGSYSTLFERVQKKLNLKFNDLTFDNFRGLTVKEEDFA
jgi:adenylate cyclase class 2